MKKITLLILLFAIKSFSQTDLKKAKISQIKVDSIIKDYKTKEKIESYTNKIKIYQDENYQNNNAISSNILNKKLNKYFNQAIFGSSDISNNSSALGLAIKNNETSISLNTILALNKPGKHQWLLKPGIFTEGKSSLFNLYSDGSWSNNIGINFGVVYKFHGVLSYSNDNRIKHQKDRKRFIDSILTQKKEFISLYEKVNPLTKIKALDIIISLNKKGEFNFEKFKENEIDSLKKKFLDKKEIIYLNREIGKLNNKNISKIDSILKSRRANDNDSLKLIYELKIKNNLISKESYERLNKLRIKKGAKHINDSLNVIVKNFKSINICNQSNIVNKEFNSYDNKFSNSGYSLKWIAFDNSFSNHVYKIDSLNILKDLKIKEFDNKFKWESSINYNYLRKRNSLLYIQTGFSLVVGNFLDNNLIFKTPKLINDSGNLIVKDTDNKTIGNYNSLNDDSYFGNFNFYGLYAFPGYNKMGLSLNFSHNFLMGNKNDNPYFQKNFTLLFGPVFRNIKKDGVNKVSIGIEAGFENAIYDSKISDDFIARIRVGIPIKSLF